MPNLRSHGEPVGRVPRLPEYPLEPQSCPQGQAASFAGPHPDRAQGAPSAGFLLALWSAVCVHPWVCWPGAGVLPCA